MNSPDAYRGSPSVIVTGGASGIGRQTGLLLSSMGWAVSVADYSREGAAATVAEIEGLGGEAIALYVDVRSVESCDEVLVAHEAAYGPVRGLVNCAGVNRRGLAVETSESEWDHVVGVNLRGTFFMSRAAGRSMISTGIGSIVNISSMYGHSGGMNVCAYSASKSGVLGITKSLALEWGKYGVRVNCVSPGWIETPLTRAAFQHEAYTERIVSRTALQRLGDPDEVASAIEFLLSDRARFVTGTALSVDGGFMSGDAALIPVTDGPQ